MISPIHPNVNQPAASRIQCYSFIAVFLLLCAWPQFGYCQYSVSFSPATATINRSANDDVIKEFSFKQKGANNFSAYTATILVDAAATTLNANDYEISETSFPFATLADAKFYIKITKDGLADRDRKLVLKLVIKDGGNNDEPNNQADVTDQVLRVKVISVDSLEGFKYLAYVGTNFDLVDGVKAKNLFFATNIFVPRYREAVGFSVSLYGNRTLTTTDTSANVSFNSSIHNYSTDSAKFFYSNANFTRTRVTDNLGAFCAPLIPLWGLSAQGTPIQLYWSPQAEFIWRRTIVTGEYTNPIVTDSTIQIRPSNFHGIEETSLKTSNTYNLYDIYLSLPSFTAVHETKSISVRVSLGAAYHISYFPQGSVTGGLNTNYTRTEDLSYWARMWVTEATTGITLQAEVFNNHKYAQPYFGVTLSKAINFRNLGTVFSPVVSR